jgi:hypothetical protein
MIIVSIATGQMIIFVKKGFVDALLNRFMPPTVTFFVCKITLRTEDE